MAENKTYSEQLKDPRWQKKRLKILERDNWTCQLCYSEIHTLQIHHLKYNGLPWEASDEDLITLCENCHKIIEEIKDKEKKSSLSFLKEFRAQYEFCINPEFRPPFVELFIAFKKLENKIHKSYLLDEKEDLEDII